MPSDERRRELKRKAKDAVRSESEREWETHMLLSPEELKALLDHLDATLGVQPCDHTLRFTIAWAEEHGLDPEALTDSVFHFGGGCDCEVLGNVDPAGRVDTWPAYMERYG